MQYQVFEEKPLYLVGLNNPDVLRFFSTIIDISEPIFFLFKIFSNLVFDSLSIAKGETAKGSGSKLPLVISTLIRPYAFKGNKIKIKRIIFFIIIYFIL